MTLSLIQEYKIENRHGSSISNPNTQSLKQEDFEFEASLSTQCEDTLSYIIRPFKKVIILKKFFVRKKNSKTKKQKHSPSSLRTIPGTQGLRSTEGAGFTVLSGRGLRQILGLP